MGRRGLLGVWRMLGSGGELEMNWMGWEVDESVMREL
jgi:hypothetical protein